MESRVALVTCGSRGIGKTIALALADAGSAVAVNYRARAAEAKAVAEAIRQGGGRAAAIGADVSVGSAMPTMVRDVDQRRHAVLLIRPPKTQTPGA